MEQVINGLNPFSQGVVQQDCYRECCQIQYVRLNPFSQGVVQQDREAK